MEGTQRARSNVPDMGKIARASAEAGIQPYHWNRFRRDLAFRARLASSMYTGAIPPPVFIDPAHQGYYELGMPLFGPVEWEALFKFKLDPAQWEAAKYFPWLDLGRRDEYPCPFWPGEAVMDTHFAFLAIEQITDREAVKQLPTRQMTLKNICGNLRENLANWRSYPRVADPNELGPFSSITETCWQLMSLMPVDGTAVIEQGLYRRMTVSEYVLGLLLYYQKYSEWPEIGGVQFHRRAARCHADPVSQEIWYVYINTARKWQLTVCPERSLPEWVEAEFDAVTRNLPLIP